jgi:DNA-binding SARP family transcriptional activator
LADGLTIETTDDSLSIAQWNLRVPAGVLSTDAVDVVAELFEETSKPAALDLDVVVPSPAETTPLTEAIDDEGWQPPTWPVMVHVLGEPVVLRDGDPIALSEQLTSALAFLAIKRDVAVYDVCEALWGDDPVPDHRVRDLLSRLRKTVGGVDVVSHVEDGRVRAGPDLGSDLAVFCALSERAQHEPRELSVRLHEMVHLIRGRPFASAGSAIQHWRWVDIDQLEALWMHRTSTAAWELAKLYLDRGDPSTARGIAELGLRADALSSPLTEVLMEAYAGLHCVEAAQKVYAAHDRALTHLGGASEETRRVLERILATARAEDTLDTAVGS